MLFKEISYEAICPDCKRETLASSYTHGQSISLDQIHTKIKLSTCYKCQKQYVISHLKCVLDLSQKTRVLDLRLQCTMCYTVWTVSRSYGTEQMPLSNFSEEIRNETMCISPWCDNKGVKIVKVTHIDS